MLITEEYRELNRAKHAKGSYGVSGHRWAGSVDDLATQRKIETILDYGCGQGSLKTELLKAGERPYKILEYDPAVAGKEEKPIRADLVVCGDVLEHIEPECLDDVLNDIRNIARMGVFLVVATKPASKTFPDGRNLHLIVEPAMWWMPKIMVRWRVRAFQDLGGEFVCIGTTK